MNIRLKTPRANRLAEEQRPLLRDTPGLNSAPTAQRRVPDWRAWALAFWVLVAAGGWVAQMLRSL